jgi:light-regulated signal transduction histidine kinase (bacteriophytochrome)
MVHWLTPIGGDLMVSTYYIINDLKQVQEELEHTVRELRRSNDDLEQFASVASHDLQEPLRKVQSFGNMLEARFSDILGAEGKDLVRRMQNAAGRMRSLVTGLLSFSRLSGNDAESFEAVDLHSLMQELAGDLRTATEGPEPVIEVEGQLPFVSGIESQLRHLFHNLLNNAVKFTAASDVANIRISAGALAPADLTRLAPGVQAAGFARIVVRDSGIGFEAEYAEKIFGLFERLHGMNEYQGTGIGLAIARRVVERHQGAIWAESEPGNGAMFIILLPRPR